MQRVLDPGQIEAFAQGQRSIPRVRLADPAAVFATRAARLRQLSAGHALADYLQLMAAVADTQQLALRQRIAGARQLLDKAHLEERTALAREHGMPLLQATGWQRESSWRALVIELCDGISGQAQLPTAVAEICRRIRALPAAELEQQADRLLTADSQGIDAAAAPFIMAALQVYWTHLVSSLTPDLVACVNGADAPGVCPICGTLPVASVVRAEKAYQGYRYLHCALCATEWHLVRVKCSQCLSTDGIHYHSLTGSAVGSQDMAAASAPVRAEACDSCRAYRKICYQEFASGVEPVADDLATLTLDLLMSEAGYQRASGNPLLWHTEPA